MVKADMGVNVLPRRSIANAIASGDVKAVRITKAGVFRKWYGVTLSGIPATRLMEDFIHLLIKQGPSARKMARRLPRLAS